MYVGPETLMPLASALAAVAGVSLMFWRKTVGVCRASYRFISRSASKLFTGGRGRN
jgi:hypothetical protein